MRSFTLGLVFVVCVHVAQSALTEAQIASTSKLVRRTCKSKNKVDDIVLNAMVKGNFENTDKNTKCYLNCCLSMVKLVTKDGHMDVESANRQILTLPEPRQAPSKRSLDECKDVGSMLSDKCDIGYEIAKCLYFSNPKLVILIVFDLTPQFRVSDRTWIKMGKIKLEPTEEEGNSIVIKEEELTYEEKLENVSVIAKPMASKKLTKKCHKLIKKAAKHKTFVRNGLKDVQSRIRKGETGIVLLAGDVTPIEIMCHIPGVCEDKSIPYCYIPSRTDLGASLGVKRGSLMVLIREHESYIDVYNECKEEITNLAVEL